MIYEIGLLTIVSLFNAILKMIIPFELDIIVGFFILFSFVAKLSVMKNLLKRSLLDPPIITLILAGLATLSSLVLERSDYLEETAINFIYFIMVMAMGILVFQLLSSFDDIFLTLRIFSFGVTFIALIGFISLMFGINLIYIGGEEIIFQYRWGSTGGRLGGIYSQPNIFATVLILAFPVTISFALIGNKNFERYIWAGAAGICAISLMATQSRSGIIGAVLGLMIMSTILIKYLKTSNFVRLIIFIALFVYCTLGATNILPHVLQRLSPSFQTYQLRLGRPEENRFNLWQVAIPFAFKHPFGLGTEAGYLIGESFGVGRKISHNIFVDYLVAYGWLGFIGICLLAIFPLKKLWKFIISVENKKMKIIGIGLLSGLIGFWTHNFFHSVIHWVVIWVYFACVASLIKLNLTHHVLK